MLWVRLRQQQKRDIENRKRALEARIKSIPEKEAALPGLEQAHKDALGNLNKLVKKSKNPNKDDAVFKARVAAANADRAKKSAKTELENLKRSIKTEEASIEDDEFRARVLMVHMSSVLHRNDDIEVLNAAVGYSETNERSAIFAGLKGAMDWCGPASQRSVESLLLSRDARQL